ASHVATYAASIAIARRDLAAVGTILGVIAMLLRMLASRCRCPARPRQRTRDDRGERAQCQAEANRHRRVTELEGVLPGRALPRREGVIGALDPRLPAIDARRPSGKPRVGEHEIAAPFALPADRHAIGAVAFDPRRPWRWGVSTRRTIVAGRRVQAVSQQHLAPEIDGARPDALQYLGGIEAARLGCHEGAGQRP